MITIREMRESDYHTCADMMWKRWACDEVKDDPELAINYGYMFLYYSLATASKAFVADEDGKAIGLLILEIKDGHPMKIQYFLQMLEHVAAFCTDPNGYDNVKEWIALEKEYRTADQLVRGKGIDAEIQLFINDENHRRQGIGSEMFRHMAGYLHEKGVEKFYLHSDQCSNHEFYVDKRHMDEFNKRSSTVTVGDVHNADLFIYVDDTVHQMNL